MKTSRRSHSRTFIRHARICWQLLQRIATGFSSKQCVYCTSLNPTFDKEQSLTEEVSMAKTTLFARQISGLVTLVAPYCAIPRDYLSDTPLLRAMGFLVSQQGQSMRCGGETPPPPPKRGISAILARYFLKTGKWVRYPPLRYYLEKVLCDMGGYLALGC